MVLTDGCWATVTCRMMDNDNIEDHSHAANYDDVDDGNSDDVDNDNDDAGKVVRFNSNTTVHKQLSTNIVRVTTATTAIAANNTIMMLMLTACVCANANACADAD
jgi:hypothetical protein